MTTDDLLLIAIGGAACKTAYRIFTSAKQPMRVLLLDTDDSLPETFLPAPGLSIHVFGSRRFLGHGSGGDTYLARQAFKDEETEIDALICGVKLALVLTYTGGGTAGAVPDLLRRLVEQGTLAMTFAVTPFAFEGQTRQDASKRLLPLFEEDSRTLSVLPMSQLTAGAESLSHEEAFAKANAFLAHGMGLIWRLLASPGFIAFDASRLSTQLRACSGTPLRLVTLSAFGEGRAEELIAQIATEPALHAECSCIVLGILAGQDLRLVEIGSLMDALRARVPAGVSVELGTVVQPDLEGAIQLSMWIFENRGRVTQTTEGTTTGAVPIARRSRTRKSRDKQLGATLNPFSETEPTSSNGENLDIPTYERRQIQLY